MLQSAEVNARVSFYEGIFGAERITSKKIFPDKLWPVGNYDEKIKGLIERGFKDPQKMITSSPAILGYSFDNIDEKIKGLIDRGFTNPQKMITSLPAILGLSFDNIDRKLKLCRKLKVEVIEFIAYTVVFIGMSSEHYIPILRTCKAKGLEPTPKNVLAVYKSKAFT